jgi:hypothetical protein
MSEGKPERAAISTAEEDDPSAEEELSSDALDVDALKARADMSALITLARAYRSGKAPGGRDMKRCFEAYRAAAELGSAEAEYAVALFYMTGGVVKQDLREGATRLRAAAEKGSVAAKVYLGNLYELGIHYKADPEKADVWYRNAARGARVTSEPGSDEYARDLADLGCARYVLALVESGSLDEDEKARLLQKARAHGYGLRLRDETAPERPTIIDALQTAEKASIEATSESDAADGSNEQRARAAPPSVAPREHDERAREVEGRSASKEKERKDSSKPSGARAKADSKTALAKPKAAGSSHAAAALAAFGYALLFTAAGVGAGYAATLGAHELVARGHELPGLGTRTQAVFPIVLGLVGVLPTCLVYRLGTVLKALVIAGSLAGIGWVAWGTGQATVHEHRPVQALVFGLAGLLGGLFVLGLFGGTKRLDK